MHRLVLLTLLLMPAAARAEITFHLYGAENCAPCHAFLRDHLRGVEAIAGVEGFAVRVHAIPDLRHMGAAGIYGPDDPLLRAALARAGLDPYPPVFLVSDGGRLSSVHGADWGAALLAARDAR